MTTTFSVGRKTHINQVEFNQSFSKGLIKSNLTQEKKDKFDKMEYDKIPKGQCVIDSFVVYQKLYKLKPIRVRGYITNKECVAGKEEGKPDVLHYWVEANDMVYDDNIRMTVIVPKNEYYAAFQIRDMEVADDGIFKNECTKTLKTYLIRGFCFK